MKKILTNKWIILLKKALLIILITIITILIIAFLFLKFYPSLGGMVTEKDIEDYKKRAINYKDGKFINEENFELKYEKTENKYLSTKDTKPKEKLKVENPSIIENLNEDDLTITWLGHATNLIQMSGMNILIDPIFSEYSSPVQLLGPKRFSELPLELKDLPKINIVLITHDHYDHLDYKTIKYLKDKVDIFIVPLGVEKHLERWGVEKTKIHNIAWWEEYKINNLTIISAPARHYSNRSINDKNQTLWSSFILKNEYYQIFQSGDTGYSKHFKEIYEKYGSFDLALLDSGQYNNSWKQVHMNPEESVQASIDLNAKVAMPIHWGTFSLAFHPWDDTPERFTKKAQEENITSITPKIGQTVNYKNYNNYIDNNWWKNIE